MNSKTLAIIIKANDKASEVLKRIGTVTESTNKKMSKSIDAVSEASNKSSNSFKSMSAAVFIGNAALQASQKAINLVTNSISAAASRVDTLNNSQRTFKNMGVSASDANKVVKELNKSILGLPTSLDSAISGVVMLTASTNNAKTSQKVFSALNNAILGFGGTTEQVSNAVVQLSQDLGTGRITAQTWLSLTNSGLTPALAAMARQMGITSKELKAGLSDGSISVDKFQQALIELNEKGGGGMKSLQQIAKDSTAGIQSGITNAQTAITRGIANIIQAVGQKNISTVIGNIGHAFESVLTSISKTIPYLQEAATILFNNLSPSFNALWNTLNQKVFPIFTRLWKEVLEPIMPVIGVVFVGAIQLATDALNLLFSALAPVVNFMLNNKPVVLGLAAAFVTLKLAMMAQAGIAAFQAGIAAITTTTIPAAIAKITAMRALVASPMVMGAIGIGAAVAAIAFVKQKLDEFRADVEKTYNETTRAANSQTEAIKKLRNLARNGTPEQQARALEGLKNLGYSDGGFTGRGGVNEIAGVVHKGEYVVPQSQVDQNTGMPKSMGDSIFNMYGTVNLGSADAVDRFFERINAQKELGSLGVGV